ncbi:MAG TPA: leucine-rich repeat domain-containing protein, partial [Ktedonobacteraceae bacterium]|nr:leucine-rich repeat domain-containing protein [Ktedonobacteraceae bacterium]
DVCLRSIGEYSHLKELRIDGARAVGDRGMAHLASRDCPLVLLILHDTSVRGKGLANLTRLKKLKHLQLEGDRNNGLDDHDIEELAALKQLVNLELNGQVNLTDESVRSLSSLPNLQVLNLAYTGITARSISLLEKYPALRIVNLSACPKLKDAQKRLLEKKGLILAD